MKKKIFVFMFLMLLVIGVSSSYAYLKAEKGSTGNNNLSVGSLDVTLLTDISNINLNNEIPKEDSEGLNNPSTSFRIKNNAGMTASYKISLVDGTKKSTVSNKDVKYRLIRTNANTNETVTMDIKNLDSTGLIDTGTIEANVIYNYQLVIWLDINSNPNGLVFSKNILVEGMQVSSLDKSGANYPELTDNMIPVYYDKTSDTEGVWRVADKKNLNETYKWFDYNDFMWANAVTVKENGTTSRSNYLKADLGTEVKMEDITTMWVWIPRYKYVIFNGNNELSNEQEIKITFEHGIDKTGTVSCKENILTANDSSSSETCTDTINGSIINNKSTYTHPAFTFGDEELTGIWYAKFEMSTDQDSVCATSQSYDNCDKEDLNVYVKPDHISLRYQKLMNEFKSIRNMELFNNIHGFIQNENATTSSQTGEITNDDNNIDIHMQKNMEWGAVTYLAYSKYGKYGNSLYTGTNKRVYKNNWYQQLSSVYNYKTGYSGYSYNAAPSTTNVVLYNDLTDLGSGNGYKGAGASTTGTVYGIYDMNGGAYEYVMGNMVNSSGAFYSHSAGFTASPLAKYYDKYSYYSTKSLAQASVSRGRFGDATKETTKGYVESTGSWEGSYRIFPYYGFSWSTRGGRASISSYSGINDLISLNGYSTIFNSSRPVLAVSREFPWLSE